MTPMMIVLIAVAGVALGGVGIGMGVSKRRQREQRELEGTLAGVLPDQQAARETLQQADAWMREFGNAMMRIRDPQVRKEANDIIVATQNLCRYVSSDIMAYPTLQHFINVYGEQSSGLLRTYLLVESSGVREHIATARTETIEALQALEATAAGELSRAVGAKTLGLTSGSDAIQRLTEMDGYDADDAPPITPVTSMAPAAPGAPAAPTISSMRTAQGNGIPMQRPAGGGVRGAIPVQRGQTYPPAQVMPPHDAGRQALGIGRRPSADWAAGASRRQQFWTRPVWSQPQAQTPPAQPPSAQPPFRQPSSRQPSLQPPVQPPIQRPVMPPAAGATPQRQQQPHQPQQPPKPSSTQPPTGRQQSQQPDQPDQQST